jgi:hypothetical protein
MMELGFRSHEFLQSAVNGGKCLVFILGRSYPVLPLSKPCGI